VIVAAGSRFGKERGYNGKLVDFEAGPDGDWSRRSSTRWPWKRWRAALVAAWRLEPTRRKKQRCEGEEEKQVDLAPQRCLAGDKDSGGARGRWSPTAHGHCPRCRVGDW
jgi:hypothetical protein